MHSQTIKTIAYIIVGGAIAGFGTLLLMSWLIMRRTRKILNKWASESGLQVVSGEVRRYPNKGPFNSGTNFRGQIVLFLRVRGKDDLERSCWLRCGKQVGGIWFGDQTEVKWDVPGEIA